MVRQAVPAVNSWIVFSSLTVAGVGFVVLEVFRALGSSVGYNWARILTGILCLSTGAVGLKMMRSDKLKGPTLQ